MKDQDKDKLTEKEPQIISICVWKLIEAGGWSRECWGDWHMTVDRQSSVIGIFLKKRLVWLISSRSLCAGYKKNSG
jgi:hypothetical protein